MDALDKLIAALARIAVEKFLTSRAEPPDDAKEAERRAAGAPVENAPKHRKGRKRY